MTSAVLFSSIPGRYAKALFQIGKEHGILEDLLENIEVFSNFFYENKPLFSRFGIQRTKALWTNICRTGYFNEIFTSFLKILMKNHRLNIISNVASIFRKAVLEDKGERDVAVSSATNLSNAQKHEISNAICNLFKTPVNVKYTTNASLISGLVIESNGLRIDTSGKQTVRQLEKYCKSLELL